MTNSVDTAGTTRDIDTAGFDLAAVPDDFIADPYRYFAALRAERPVHRLPDGSYLLCPASAPMVRFDVIA